MEASTLQYNRVLADIGAKPGVFSKAEIDDLYTRASDSYPENAPAVEAQVRVLAITQLMADAAKLSDYTQNQTTEKRSQVFDNLRTMRGIYQGDLDACVSSAEGSNVRWGGLRRKPTRREEYPNEY